MMYHYLHYLLYVGTTNLSPRQSQADVVIIRIPSLGGLPPRQQDCCCGNRRLLPSRLQHQEGHVLRHQPLQQPRALLGSPAHHLPLRVRPHRHPAGQLQEEVDTPHPALLLGKCVFVNERVNVLYVCVFDHGPHPQPRKH